MKCNTTNDLSIIVPFRSAELILDIIEGLQRVDEVTCDSQPSGVIAHLQRHLFLTVGDIQIECDTAGL